MKRALAVALVLAATGAFAKGKRHAKVPPPAHPFADVAIAKLQVTDTRGERAVVQDKQGNVTLVSAGDLLGTESFKVTKIVRGCIVVSGPEAEISLCADRPEVPQT